VPLIGFAPPAIFSAVALRRYLCHEPDPTMLRTSFPVLRAAVFIGALVAVHGAVAGDGARPTTNTFVLVTAAAANPQPAPRPSPNGVGIAPSKPVVSNPYQVPLLQNAGSLRGAR
jgi:hypothetical protein